MPIQVVLSEIDSKPFIKCVADIVSEISSEDNAERAYNLMRLAVRCACLLDLYYETDDTIYLEETRKQRRELYQLIPKQHRKRLMSAEYRLRRFFDYERTLIGRIKIGDTFTENDVKRYLLRKSGDNLFYGKLLEVFVPEWNLTDELRIQTMLFDIGKDIVDYEGDLREGLPNVLYMYLSSIEEKNEIPHNLKEAITLAKESGVSNNILRMVSNLKQKALASKALSYSQTLEEAIIERYNTIERALKLS